MFLCVFSVRAQRAGLEQKITIENKTNSVPLADFISFIKDNSTLEFKYKPDWLGDKTITISNGNFILRQLLEKVLKQVNMDYIFVEPSYIVLLKGATTNFTFSQKQSKDKEEGPLTLGSIQIGLDSATLKGRLIAAENGEPIRGGLVSSKSGEKDVTDNNGNYSLFLPSGYNIIRYQALDISTLEVEIILNGNAALSINLYRDFVQLDEVSISARRLDENLSDNTAGSERITIEEIKKIPPFLGEADVIKSLSSLPGVGTSGETSAGFNVRGSSGSKNLILIDEGILYNGGHLFGLFGAINSDAIQSVELFKGTIPPKFGGRTSSVLQMELSDGGRATKLSGNGGAGLITSRLSLQTPVIKEVSSLSTSFRTAYPNYLINGISNRDLRTSSSFFGDLSLAYKHNFNDNNSFLKLSAYTSRDRFNIRNEIGLNYDNNLVALNYGKGINENLFLTAHYSLSNYDYSFTESTSNEFFQLDAFVGNQKLSTALQTTLFESQDLEFGFEGTLYQVNSGDVDKTVGKERNSFSFPLQQAYTLSAYFADRLTLIDKLDILAGFRATYFSEQVKVHQWGFDPRVSLNYKINKRSSVKLGYNRSRQFIHLLSNTSSITPIDIWRLSNEQINPSVANQISLGYFRNFNANNLETSVEAFYKQSDNFLDFKNGANLLGNERIEDEVIQGSAIAYGLEFYVKRNMGKLNGWVSYTFLRSFEQLAGDALEQTVNNGEYFPTFFDQPHNINALTNITFSRRFDISLNFVYNTGRPITYPNSYYRLNDVLIANYPERNNGRIPDYHRLDLSINLSTTLRREKKLEANWSLIIYNVYGRRNAYSVFFRTNQAAAGIDAFRLSIIGAPVPALSYNFKF